MAKHAQGNRTGWTCHSLVCWWHCWEPCRSFERLDRWRQEISGAGLDVCSMASLSVLFLLVAPWRCVQVALLSCFHRHGLLLHLSSHCRLTLSTASQSEYCFAWDACQVLNYESEESDWCRWPWPLFITVTIQNPSHTQSSGQWIKDQL